MRNLLAPKAELHEDAEESVAQTLALSGSPEQVNDYFYEHGWTDGLPIIPPTPDRVEKMLAGTYWD